MTHPSDLDPTEERDLVTLLTRRNREAASTEEIDTYTSMLPAVMTDVDQLYRIPGEHHAEPAVTFRPFFESESEGENES